MPSTRLSDLPSELLIKILLYLSPNDLLYCQLSGSVIRDIVQESVLLQYNCAKTLAGYEDNSNCSLSLAERLRLLISQETAWERLCPDFNVLVPIEHRSSGIYDLTGSVYVLGNINTRALHYINLPSSYEQAIVTRWSRIDVDRSLIDIGLAIYEHDLIAIVTTRPLPDSLHEIELQLLQFSTGKPHPSAREWRFPVIKWHWSRPSVGIEIVGDHLVLILSHPHVHIQPAAMIFLYQWRTAKLMHSFLAPCRSYSGLVFLSENLLLLPNALHQTLEIWKIAKSHEGADMKLIISLELPHLGAEGFLTNISCRGEPNPNREGATLNSSKPFHAAFNDSIIIFNFRLQQNMVHAELGVFASNFTFLVHRNSLLEIAQNALEEGQDLDDTDIECVPWASWGPLITRWIQFGPIRWITISAGQRCVFMRHGSSTLNVLDFNPFYVNKMKKYIKEYGDESVRCVTSSETLQDDGAFSEPVESCLPYVERKLALGTGFDGVLMDEERIIGIKTNQSEMIEKVMIMHFG